MKTIKQLSLLLLSIILILGVCGCMNTIKEQVGHSNAEYIEAIEKYLAQKYSLSFMVESLGGEYGTADNTTVKAWCYSVDGEYANIKFMSEVDKVDLSVIKDQYLHIVSAAEISRRLCAAYGNGVAYSVLESSTYPRADSITSLDEYLSELDIYFVTTHFFIKDSGNLSADEYVNMVYSIGEKAKELKLKDLCIVVWFVDELSDDVYETFSLTDTDNLYDEFLNKKYTKLHATINLLEDEITTNRESIQSSIEKDVK